MGSGTESDAHILKPDIVDHDKGRVQFMGGFGLAKKSLKQYVGGQWCADYAYSLTISHFSPCGIFGSNHVFITVFRIE